MPYKDSRAPGSRLVNTQIEIELLLRRYGLTSAHQTIDISNGRSGLLVRDPSHLRLYKRKPRVEQIKALTGYHRGTLSLDILNIQHTEESDQRPVQLLDFGGYEVRDRFQNPLAIMVSSKLLDIGEIIQPGSPRFVQPRYRCQSLPTRRQAKQLALAFLNKKLTGDEIRNKIDAATQRTALQWKTF